MNYLQEPILTAIIPIGDYERHHDNINAIIHSCEELPIKLVLVFDNQTDTSFESLRDLLHSTYNLTWDLLRVNAKSPGLARNEGLRELKTKWVTFWDSDDIPSPNETLRAISECHSATQMIIGNFKVINDKGEFEPCPQLSPSHNELNYKLVSKMPGLWRMIFRSSTVEQIIFPGLRMGEDQVFLIEILSKVSRIEFSALNLYTYVNQSDRSLTKQKSSMRDLPYALKFAITIISNSDSKYLEMQQLMQKRLFLSTIKHAKYRGKFLSLFLMATSAPFQRSLNTRNVDNGHNFSIILAGGLGNQLFQTAAALNQAIKFDSQSRLISTIGNPRLNYFENPEIDNLILPDNLHLNYKDNFSTLSKKASNFSLRLNLEAKKRRIGYLLNWVTSLFLSFDNRKFVRFFTFEDLGYIGDFPNIPKSINFGYFQTFEYASEPQVLDKMLALVPREDSPELAELERCATEEQPLIVHIRLTDYLLEDNFGTPDESYYNRAIDLQLTQGSFGSIWVFSDDIDGAKKLIPKNLHIRVRWIQSVGNDASTTWQAMRLGKGYVVANSSYSWWAAFLAFDRGATVIAPNPWFKGIADPRKLIPPHWIQLPARIGNHEQGAAE